MSLELKIHCKLSFDSSRPSVFYLSMGDAFFPSENWSDSPLVIADMWLDELLQLSRQAKGKVTLELYEDAYEIAAERNDAELTLNFRHRGGVEGRVLPDSFTLPFADFVSHVVRWVHSMNREVQASKSRSDAAEMQTLMTKATRLEASAKPR